MRESFLNFSPPSIGQEEIDEVVQTLKSGWITTGQKTKRFESEFKSFVGADSALALNSCTAGLHLSLVVSGIGPGDEVITTPMTFAASVNVIEHVGAKPVLVDVQSDTLNIDPHKIEEKITPRTKAIMVVHFAGHPVDYDEIHEIAKKHDLIIIEDAAHAVAARYRDQMVGSMGNLTSFSFYATKNLTTGEGGMLVGPQSAIDEAKILSLHGMSGDAWRRYSKGAKWHYDIVAPGFKYNMTDIQASLGLPQLLKLPDFQKRREEIFKLYNESFDAVGLFEIPTVRDYVDHAYHLYVLRLRLDELRIDRNEFMEELAKLNIGTSVHFIPINTHPFYREKYDLKPSDYPVAMNAFSRIISLPLNAGLSDSDVNDVISAVVSVAKNNSVRG